MKQKNTITISLGKLKQIIKEEVTSNKKLREESIPKDWYEDVMDYDKRKNVKKIKREFLKQFMKIKEAEEASLMSKYSSLHGIRTPGQARLYATLLKPSQPNKPAKYVQYYFPHTGEASTELYKITNLISNDVKVGIRGVELSNRYSKPFVFIKGEGLFDNAKDLPEEYKNLAQYF